MRKGIITCSGNAFLGFWYWVSIDYGLWKKIMNVSIIVFVACFLMLPLRVILTFWRNVRLRAERKRRSWKSPNWILTSSDKTSWGGEMRLVEVQLVRWTDRFGVLHRYTPPREWRNCCLFPGRTTICHSRAPNYLKESSYFERISVDL
jgi:hypothetical protein